MSRPWVIYSMKDPRSAETRYVGFAFDFERRKKCHIYDCLRGENNYKARWLRTLLDDGLQPEYEILERGSGDWQTAERNWIAKFRAAGARLTNVSDGGRVGRHGATNSDEWRAKTRATLKGHAVSAETRAKLSAASKGRKLTEEHKAKLRKPIAEPFRQTHLEKLALLHESNRGSRRSAEARARMSAARKGKATGRKMTPEHIALMAAARDTPEVRAKIGAGHKGLKHSPEVRAKMSESARRRSRKVVD